MSRPKCEICGKDTEHQQFEGIALCPTHAVAVHRFIEHMKRIPMGVCLIVRPDSLEQALEILQKMMEVNS